MRFADFSATIHTLTSARNKVTWVATEDCVAICDLVGVNSQASNIEIDGVIVENVFSAITTGIIMVTSQVYVKKGQTVGFYSCHQTAMECNFYSMI